MKNIFQSVMRPKVPGSNFNLSHSHKLSYDFGQLIPSMWTELMPGDKIDMSIENFARLSPLIAPIMHKVDVTHHVFVVPIRTLWTG